MPNESTLYRWFWEKMDALTAVRPLSEATKASYAKLQREQRFERISKNISELKEFLNEANRAIEELERMGIDVSVYKGFVQKISKPINVLETSVGMTADAIKAAEEVSLDLATWYREAEQEARQRAGGDDDQYFILSAALVRYWQARNVKAVLGNQPGSFVMRLWPKWRDRIFAMIF